jgi:transmembrane sensor
MEKETLYRFYKGEATSDEQRRLMEWLDADQENRRIFDRERGMYNALLLFAPEEKAARGRLLNWRRVTRYAVQAAAVVILAVGIGWGYVSYKERSWANLMTRVAAPEGQRINLTLQDGTNVWLNSGAEIEYPSLFAGNSRQVRLSGEALFDVRHDAECPFEVETFATKINVLGTKFNVIADETYGRFSAALLQGRIKVTNLLDPRRQEIVMKPDDIVNLSNGRLFVETIRDPEALCWTEGLVRISGLPFDELMAKFEQVFDVKIVIARNSIPDIGKISGKIRVNDGIENALHILQYAADFSFEKDEETNVVTIR